MLLTRPLNQVVRSADHKGVKAGNIMDEPLNMRPARAWDILLTMKNSRNFLYPVVG